MSNIEQTDGEVRRLPLWKACLDDMRQMGLHYGQEWKAEFFEEKLRCKRDTMQYGLAVSEIRKALESDGFYLCGHGQKGTAFVILEPAANVDVMLQYQRAAADALRRGVILGTNTQLDTLTESERLRHEQVLERMAIKSALLQRAKSVHAFVTKNAPKLLKEQPHSL
jgi:hypothetical protein